MSTIYRLYVVYLFHGGDFEVPEALEGKMAHEIEFKELNPLQVLLSVFVKFGLTTPYDLISQAGMSVGLTSPALRRMEEAGLVTGTLGPRKRMQYGLTEKGEDELRKSLCSGRPYSSLLGSYDTFESAPRAILLAWATSGLDEALNCVDQVQEELRFQAQQQKKEADKLKGYMLRQANLFPGDPAADKGMLIATAYRWIKATSDAELLKLQAEAMGTIVPRLSELPTSPQILTDEGSVG
jgi:DNA-binding PadR family transcriptional regulator